ncbi:hypothetical protein [Vibrio europaeus]|uniref:hypothetical protein n=1 Tax=Vibrio europaeus TaxID=300876 RepID=UPI00148D3DDF|nr:hypothetical protein [Vibrio europaeus]NOH23859.1 hypothetical protein [Vibrio europaeus]
MKIVLKALLNEHFIGSENNVWSSGENSKNSEVSIAPEVAPAKNADRFYAMGNKHRAKTWAVRIGNDSELLEPFAAESYYVHEHKNGRSTYFTFQEPYLLDAVLKLIEVKNRLKS